MYIGPLNPIYAIHMVALVQWISSKRIHVLVAEALVHGPILLIYKSLLLLNSFQGSSHSICKPSYLTNYRINLTIILFSVV